MRIYKPINNLIIKQNYKNMKKKLLKSMRVLLVAAGLGVGVNGAWGDTTTTLWEKGTTGHAWEDADATKYNAETAPDGWVMETNDNLTTSLEISKDESENPVGLKISHSIRKAYFKATKAITTQDGSTLTIDAVWNTGNSTGGSGNYNYIKFGDVEIRALGQNSICKIVIGGVETDFGNQADSRGGDITISLTINKVSKAVSYTLTCNSGKTGSGTITSTTFDSFEMGYVYVTDPKNRQTIHHTLKSIKIQETVSSAASVDYTINYQLSGTTVKKAEGTDYDETVITAETVIDGEGEYEGNHYLIVAETAPTLTLDADGTNVLNVPVRAPYTATLSVTTTINGSSTIVNTPLTETDDKVCGWSRKWSLYSQKDGVYYKVDDTSKFSESGTFTDGETISKTDVYSTAESDIVFFAEVENLSNNAYADENVSYSGGGSAMIGGSKVAWLLNLPAGYYAITGYELEDDKVFRGMTLRKSNSVATDQVIVDVTSQTDHIMTGDFMLPQATGVNLSGTTLNNKVNQSVRLDYVIIRKTDDLPPTEKIAVKSASFATYVSNYNLDFSSAKTKAYKVAVESKGVATLTEVEQVPAKTPVLLYCDGGNGVGEDIAVTTDAVSAVTGNDLVAGTGATVATTDGDYTNMILNNVDNNIGFYFANNQTVDTNRAYLHILTTLAPDDAQTNARMYMVFDNEASGISAVNSEEMKVQSCYNLSGQRISQPTKGLYIVNGKKVVIK